MKVLQTSAFWLMASALSAIFGAVFFLPDDWKCFRNAFFIMQIPILYVCYLILTSSC